MILKSSWSIPLVLVLCLASVSTGYAQSLPPGSIPLAQESPPPPAAQDSTSIAPTQDNTAEASRTEQVFSEDWWTRTRPVFEIHGYFRTRGELLHNFALDRHDPAEGSGDSLNLWPHPLDSTHERMDGTKSMVKGCHGKDSECMNKGQWGGNMRFRINPEIHLSDNLRILSQVDALDNVVVGSTSDAIGSSSAQPNPYALQAWQANTQGPSTTGIHGFRNSIDVKRVWGEYVTPLGQLRFGRMPFHWGLGMVYNAGDGLDSDWQTTYDRVQVVSAWKAWDLYFSGSWDVLSTQPIRRDPSDVYGGSPYPLASSTTVHQGSVWIARRKNAEMQRLALKRGELVLNGGLLLAYKMQDLDLKQNNATQNTDPKLPPPEFEHRGVSILSPDLWFQALYSSFRFEAELASSIGEIANTPEGKPLPISMWGLTTQSEFRAVEDKLRLQLGGGWASGDPAQKTLAPDASYVSGKAFRYHPDYRIDLILFRRILTRVQGAYYLRPGLEYDFLRKPNGHRIGGGLACVWSRASAKEQTPKQDDANLGVELDAQLYYHAKEGSFGGDSTELRGFYSMLQYGVLFPMGGLAQQRTDLVSSWNVSAAHTLRAVVGIVY